ncbi:MAG: purine-binding chemotaxis protein CheW [Nocardioidaceae bacterium]|jgi:chemotaxis signal transduction protein|nr:purine-binding chemotaxis protein CheW [Nocardioidaceae bacterium]
MRTVVEFQASGATYCLPVEATRAVRSAAGMIALPAPRPHVAGLLPGDPPLTVMSPFGSAGQHVIVLYVGDTTYGLLVENVTGLRHVDDADLRPAPTGQQRELVCGSVTINGQLVLLANPSAVVMSS